MPDYRYGGKVFDAHLPWPEPAPKPRPAPKRRRNKTGRTQSPHPPKCGTPSAYTRHRLKGEPIDDACIQANKDDCKRRYQQRKNRT